MTDQFDIIVAGAGHNSLVAAAYLARAGLSCLVLEARPVIGGNTMTEELTLPGFLHDTCSTTHSIFMESPIWRNQELPLAEYGLEYISADPASHVVFSDGSYITQWIDLDRTCEEISKFSRRDADTYRAMISEWRAVAQFFSKADLLISECSFREPRAGVPHLSIKEAARMAAQAAWTILMRRRLSPVRLIEPRQVRSPVDSSTGVRPRKLAKWRTL